jgi:hypothetical protein
MDGESCGEGACDDVMPLDEQGYGIMSTCVYELRNCTMPVRLQIAEGTTKDDAIALLQRITAYLEKDWQSLTRPRGWGSIDRAALPDPFGEE